MRGRPDRELARVPRRRKRRRAARHVLGREARARSVLLNLSSAAVSSPSVERVREAHARAGLGDTIVELPGAARTARSAADYLGCEVGQIAKSLVVRAEGSDGALLVMSSGAKR